MNKLRAFLTFRYIVYLIIICLLTQFSSSIKDFLCFFNKEFFWIEIAILLFLLLIICVPYTRTKYKNYISYLFREYIIVSFFIIISFALFVFCLEKENLFILVAFISVTAISLINKICSEEKEIEFINNKEKTFVNIDNPIKSKKDDLLGREDFIKNVSNILSSYNNEFRDKGIILTLSAGWGEGKTSCINLLKELLSKETIYEFIDINPWFNDTKEKLLNAIFGEINHFAKTNFPYKSFEREFDDIIKLSNIKFGNIELALDKFTDDKNIQHKIKNIGEILKGKYLKRIVVILDDLDRLNKDNILFILRTVQMFREYSNIIFILSCDYEKVEQILCENSEPCVKNNEVNNEIKKTLYYKGYLEKISTIKIDLPKINHFYICEIFKNKMITVLESIKDNSSKLFEKKYYRHVFVDRFKTIRDINRFFNAFVISYPKIMNDVDIFNYINLLMLQVFYPSLYKDAYENRYQWCEKTNEIKLKFWEIKDSSFSDNKKSQMIEELKKDLQYFKNLTLNYTSDDKKMILDLISIVSPVYNLLMNGGIEEKRKMSQKPSYYNNSYFKYKDKYKFYFENVFNKEIEKKFNELQKEDTAIFNDYLKNLEVKQKDDDEILSFLYSIKEEILNFFSYILSNFNRRFISLYKELIFCLVKESNSIIDVNSYTTIAIYISQIISLCYENKNNEYNEFYKELVRNSNSIVLLIDICRFAYNKDTRDNEIVKDINYLIDGKISLKLEAFLNSICSEEYSYFIYAWILNSYTAYQPDIFNLSSNDFIKVRQRVKKTMPYIESNKNFFDIFVWSKLKNALENIEKVNGFIDDTSEKNAIFYINLWGKENIKNLLVKEKDKNLFDYCLNNNRTNKLIEESYNKLLKKLVKADAEEKRKIAFEEDIEKYDFVKNLNYRIDAISALLYSMNNNKYIQRINLLKVEFVYKNSIEDFDDDYFNLLQEKVEKIITNIKNNNINTKYMQLDFILYLICDKELESKLRKKIDNIITNLSIRDFTLEVTIETKENLLDKY